MTSVPTGGSVLEREVVAGPGLPSKIGPYSHAVRAGGLVLRLGPALISIGCVAVVADDSAGR